MTFVYFYPHPISPLTRIRRSLSQTQSLLSTQYSCVFLYSLPPLLVNRSKRKVVVRKGIVDTGGSCFVTGRASSSTPVLPYRPPLPLPLFFCGLRFRKVGELLKRVQVKTDGSLLWVRDSGHSLKFRRPTEYEPFVTSVTDTLIENERHRDVFRSWREGSTRTRESVCTW